MHEHDPRRSQFFLRSSPPRAYDFSPSLKVPPKLHLPHSSHYSDVSQSYQAERLPQPFYPQYPHPYWHHQHQHQQHQHQQPPYPEHQINKLTSDPSSFVNPHFPSMFSSLSSNVPSLNNQLYPVDEFEDVDEDQISDLDEEEELHRSYQQCRQRLQKQPDVTTQLLDFADMVSSDIRKFFGRTKEQDDACDVYEDKWTTSKSGRELYYADLLRIAQGDTEPTNKTTKMSSSSLSSPSSSSLSPRPEADNRLSFSGRRDDTVGVGPLGELFEHNVSSSQQQTCANSVHSEPAKLSGTKDKPTSRKNSTSRFIPMHERNFPASFWREPSSREAKCISSSSSRPDTGQLSMLTSSKLPDFSDLVESWQIGGDKSVCQ